MITELDRISANTCECVNKPAAGGTRGLEFPLPLTPTDPEVFVEILSDALGALVCKPRLYL